MPRDARAHSGDRTQPGDASHKLSGDRNDVAASPAALSRSDARRNHARIVHAAQTVLAESEDATLRSIATHAGVGQGTLYRHFRDRDALLLEVYHDDLEALAENLRQLMRSHPPLTALRLWFRRLTSFSGNKEALAAGLRAGSSADAEEAHRTPLPYAAALLLDAGKQAGEIRPDLGVGRLLELLSRLWQATPGPGPSPSLDLLDLIIDGIRPRTSSSDGAQSPAKSQSSAPV